MTCKRISAVHLDPTSPFGTLFVGLELDCSSEHCTESELLGQDLSCSVPGCPTPETETSLNVHVKWNFAFATFAAHLGIAFALHSPVLGLVQRHIEA